MLPLAALGLVNLILMAAAFDAIDLTLPETETSGLTLERTLSGTMHTGLILSPGAGVLLIIGDAFQPWSLGRPNIAGKEAATILWSVIFSILVTIILISPAKQIPWISPN